jgi:hypothetical protein
MRNRLLMGVTTSALTLSALTFAAAPASAQVQVNAEVTVERDQDDARWDDDDDFAAAFQVSAGENVYGSYRPAGFGIQIYGGGSANEYGPYGYRERGYGGYNERGFRHRGSSLRVAFEYGRRDGFEAGLDAARYGRFEPMRHRYYRSTRGWSGRYGPRDAYDVNYRNGFRAGYDEGYRRAYRESRRYRRW